MSRILVISDIHANLTALEAVIEAAGSVDAVWCLGDLVGYGPDPNECIALVQTLPNLVCLLGNHDSAALGNIDLEAFNREARQSARWMKSILSKESVEFLASLPERQIIANTTLAHGSPRNPVWEYLLDIYTAMVNFGYFFNHLCLVGHTHMPTAFIEVNGAQDLEYRMIPLDGPMEVRDRAILNPGSVGQPRDHDPRAAFAILHPEENRWDPRRVEYDISSVQERIYNLGLPRRHALRLSQGW